MLNYGLWKHEKCYTRQNTLPYHRHNKWVNLYFESFLQHILHCLESQPSLHISFGSSQGYGHLFRLGLSSVDKSLRYLKYKGKM